MKLFEAVNNEVFMGFPASALKSENDVMKFCVFKFFVAQYFPFRHNKLRKFQLVESHFAQFIVKTNIKSLLSVKIFRILSRKACTSI